MKRLVKDFTPRIAKHGFSKTKSRLWVQCYEYTAGSVYFFRSGSTYGAPRTSSVDIQVMLGIHVLNAPGASGVGIDSYKCRKPDGHAYHHRFNSKSWSTYDRCLDELELFAENVALPWFTDQQDPGVLLQHPDIRPDVKGLLIEALNGNVIQENVTQAKKQLGIK